MTEGPAGATYTYSWEDHPHGVTQTVSGSASVGTRILTYDADGNVTKIERVNIETQAMLWDALGRLTSTRVTSPAGVERSVVSNVYDVDRQRVISTVDAVGTVNDTVTVTLPGMDFTIGRDAAGEPAVVNANQHKSIGGVNVAMRSRTGTAAPVVQWVLGNHQGSVAVTINASTGAVARNWYMPYGNERDTTGVNYLTNRYYDPTLGTFISVDQLVTATGEPYHYAAGKPTTLSDPNGLCATFGSVQDSDGNWHGESYA